MGVVQRAARSAPSAAVRPAMEGPRVLRWMTTLKHFRTWSAVNGGVYLAGCIRPAPEKKRKSQLHPQIGH